MMLAVAAVHAALAIPCGIAAVLGTFPAKPAKFAISISILLVTLALILRVVPLDNRVRAAIEWTLGLTMLVEMTAILAQALRGVGSHFNTSTSFDSAVWNIMMVAIVIALVALVALAWLASSRPLDCEPMLALAIRLGLWLVLLAAVSGFAMGGLAHHDVAPRGDLRVPHAFALHALQVLPIAALIAGRLPFEAYIQWSVFGLAAFAWIAACILMLLRAFAGLPAW